MSSPSGTNAQDIVRFDDPNDSKLPDASDLARFTSQSFTLIKASSPDNDTQTVVVQYVSAINFSLEMANKGHTVARDAKWTCDQIDDFFAWPEQKRMESPRKIEHIRNQIENMLGLARSAEKYSSAAYESFRAVRQGIWSLPAGNDLDKLIDYVNAFVVWWTQLQFDLVYLKSTIPQIQVSGKNPLRMRSVATEWVEVEKKYSDYRVEIDKVLDTVAISDPAARMALDQAKKEERQRKAEEQRLAQERRQVENILEEERQRKTEEERRQTEKRLEEEDRRLAEECRRAEKKSLEEERQPKAEEERWLAERKRLEERQCKAEDEPRRTEKTRLVEEGQRKVKLPTEGNATPTLTAPSVTTSATRSPPPPAHSPAGAVDRNKASNAENTTSSPETHAIRPASSHFVAALATTSESRRSTQNGAPIDKGSQNGPQLGQMHRLASCASRGFRKSVSWLLRRHKKRSDSLK